MSLWTLLALFAGCSAFGGSLGAALVMNGSSLLVAGLTGAFLGGLATCLPHVLRSRIQSVASLSADGPTPAWLRLLYGGACVWIVVAGYLASVATRLLLTELGTWP